jgi:hypothetical protein
MARGVEGCCMAVVWIIILLCVVWPIAFAVVLIYIFLQVGGFLHMLHPYNVLIVVVVHYQLTFSLAF